MRYKNTFEPIHPTIEMVGFLGYRIIKTKSPDGMEQLKAATDFDTQCQNRGGPGQSESPMGSTAKRARFRPQTKQRAG